MDGWLVCGWLGEVSVCVCGGGGGEMNGKWTRLRGKRVGGQEGGNREAWMGS